MADIDVLYCPFGALNKLYLCYVMICFMAQILHHRLRIAANLRGRSSGCSISDGAVPICSVPSEARKRGSGGGSPRKYDNILTGPSDLGVQSVMELYRAACRAKRENGGLGEDPPGSTMTY